MAVSMKWQEQPTGRPRWTAQATEAEEAQEIEPAEEPARNRAAN